MELKFFIILFAIIILVLYHIFEARGIYEFEHFAYKIGITLKRITLKINVRTFDTLKKDFYKIDNANYKIVSNNICLARFGSEKIPLVMYFRPIPMFSYKIIIDNKRYIVTLKISIIYLIIIGFLVYDIFYSIFIKQKILFEDLYPLIIYTLLFIFLIVISIYQMKRIAKNFIRILKNNK